MGTVGLFELLGLLAAGTAGYVFLVRRFIRKW